MPRLHIKASRHHAWKAIALTAAASAITTGFLVTSAQADPKITAKQVQKAFNAAEAASEAVNAAQSNEKQLRTRISQVSSEIATVQKSYDVQRDALASTIVQQQMDQPLGPTVSLLASKNPDTFLRGLSTIDALNTTRSDQLDAFTKVAAELKNRKNQLAAKQAQLAKVTEDAARNEKKLKAVYAKAKKQLDDLNAAQRATFNRSTGSSATTAAQAKATAPSDSTITGASSTAAATALKFALSQVGKPYVWGATGPNAYDCSGLMLASYAAAGVSLPRTAAAQLAATTPIAWSDLQPGDLVGYANGHHIGMYVGNGMVVHAPHPGAVVQVVPMAWGGGFSVARRVG